ncbi:E3 ubiquitin-protein ligase upl4 [Stylosanthes scabra]|uniref:E3 ubiquitin-protein ligase upl4 n=1 Tax=Stylosanthes scabra TaxID=79078 RepID=A0ABU6RAS3_9FABA|nr:E3 ubiquitin-protein ligase upl4 [Stylosanthes scabra]
MHANPYRRQLSPSFIASSGGRSSHQQAPTTTLRPSRSPPSRVVAVLCRGQPRPRPRRRVRVQPPPFSLCYSVGSSRSTALVAAVLRHSRGLLLQRGTDRNACETLKLTSGSVLAFRTLYELNISSILSDILATSDFSHGLPTSQAVVGHFF